MKAGMIVTDLDGTLLRDDKTVSDFTIDVIKKYQSEGGIFVAATARPVRAASEYMKMLNLDSGIFHNGAVIQEKGRTTGGYGVKNAGELVLAILKKYPFSNIAVEAEVEVTSLSEMEKYNALLPDELYLQLSENKIGMIMNQSATKYNAISFLAERYQIRMDDVIAFGDDYNDLEMIERCGKGIAVSNALEIVKSAAREVCESNQKDGVARWIKGNLL